MIKSQKSNKKAREYVFKLSDMLKENLSNYTELSEGILRLQVVIREKEKQLAGVEGKIETLKEAINRAHTIL